MNNYRKVLAKIDFLDYYYLHIIAVTVAINRILTQESISTIVRNKALIVFGTVQIQNRNKNMPLSHKKVIAVWIEVLEA